MFRIGGSCKLFILCAHFLQIKACDKNSSPYIEVFQHIWNCSSTVQHPNFLRPKSYIFAPKKSSHPHRIEGFSCTNESGCVGMDWDILVSLGRNKLKSGVLFYKRWQLFQCVRVWIAKRLYDFEVDRVSSEVPHRISLRINLGIIAVQTKLRQLGCIEIHELIIIMDEFVFCYFYNVVWPDPEHQTRGRHYTSDVPRLYV